MVLFMIPYVLWLVSIFLVGMCYYHDPKSFLIAVVIVSVFFGGYLGIYGVTEEAREVNRVNDSAQKEIDRKPVTSKVELSDGCSLYYYYGNGSKSEYTTKFVRCTNSSVDTEKKWSCGTAKVPKTCTEYITTKDSE